MPPDMTATTPLDTMKLYYRVERIYNELRELGYADGAPLDVEAVFPFDQYHYFGTEAVDAAIEYGSITSESRVLDVGSGLGGPARYLAHKVGAHVTAVELQQHVHDVALDLTTRCGLTERVRHVCADFVETDTVGVDYDVLVSWLAFLHIPNRERLLERCLESLKSGGRLFVEDFHEIGKLTPPEREDLRIDVGCEWLPSLETFARQCEQAGFVSVKTVDLTPRSTVYAAERCQSFRDSRDRQVAVHGEDVVVALDRFFSVVAKLFASGHFGVGRVIAYKA